ncbi:hypothetical protein K466DRAFT_504723, partial [Polyporus arcularius HHB13444]
SSDVPALHALMRRHGAVVGGSAVLRMVCPIFDDVMDVDFFVPMAGVGDLVQHFKTVDGYVTRKEETYQTSSECMRGDFCYVAGIGKRIRLERGDNRVDIMGVGVGDEWDSVLAPIASSWTTLLYNYASVTRVNVGYPSLTLNGRGLLQTDRLLHPSFPGGTHMPELEKYQLRGFEFQTHADEWDLNSGGDVRPCAESWVCPLMTRSFADAGCLRIEVGEGDDSVGPVCWKFGGVPCPVACTVEGNKRVAAEVHLTYCCCN